MNDSSPSSLLRFLHKCACVVIIMWGIKMASDILVLILMSLLLAYGILPLPKWLMRHFNVGKTSAVSLMLVVVGTINLALVFLVYEMSVEMWDKMPIYSDRLMSLYQNIVAFLKTYNFDLTTFSVAKLTTPEHILGLTRMVIPHASNFLLDSLLVSLLGWVFLLKMTEEPGKGPGRVAERLAYYGGNVQSYIAITTKTGVLTALANLVFLVILGVDFSVLWCVLYFFLHFIPNVGFIVALIPPTLMALITSGWQRALFVCGGLIIIQMLSDYLLTPILMKKGVDVSILEMTVSLMVWGFLLGPAGGILAIPLTLAVKKLIHHLEEKDAAQN